MARNEVSTVPVAGPEEHVFENAEQLHEAGKALGIAQAAVLDSFDAIKAIGRIEAAHFFATVADKLIAETAINIRNSKEYKGLPYTDNDGVLRHVADFEEFCQAFLGKSYRRTMELISNYNLLGAELYEKAEKLGFKQRDYNALKALPADERQLIAQAIEEESLEKALDIMQEMAVRNAKHKEQTAQIIESQRLTLEAKDAVISEKTLLLNKKAEQLALLENKLRAEVQYEYMTGHVELEAMHSFTTKITSEITAALRSHIVKLSHEFTGPMPRHVQLAIGQSLGLIITAAYNLADDLRIDPELDVERAANDPAKRDAEAFLKWQAEQDG